MFRTVKPPPRSIVTSAALALGVMGFVVYAASCSSPPNPEPMPSLNKFTPELPEAEPPPPPVAKVEPVGKRVDEVLDSGCSTTLVRGLSEQIIAEANCIEPGAFEKLPDLENVSLGKAVFPYMWREARDALVAAAGKAKTRKLKVNSMLRTVAQQYLLYDWYQRGRCGIKLAAEPGASNHEGGLAIDISEPGNWRKTLTAAGFRWMGSKDRWHFDYVGSKKAKRPVKEDGGLNIEAFQRLHNRNHPDDQVGEDGDWGETTEQALRAAPVEGFRIGPTCDAPPPGVP
jgi:hypothetical protein